MPWGAKLWTVVAGVDRFAHVVDDLGDAPVSQRLGRPRNNEFHLAYQVVQRLESQCSPPLDGARLDGHVVSRPERLPGTVEFDRSFIVCRNDKTQVQFAVPKM